MAARPVEVLKALSEKKITPSQLDVHTKVACTIYLLESMKYTYQEIGNIMGYSPARVKQINRQRKENYRYLVKNLDTQRVVANHIRDAEILCTKLAKQERWKDIWEIKRQLIQDLQSLGYLYKAPTKIEGQLTIQEVMELASTVSPTVLTANPN